jgi:hypothetical protein
MPIGNWNWYQDSNILLKLSRCEQVYIKGSKERKLKYNTAIKTLYVRDSACDALHQIVMPHSM